MLPKHGLRPCRCAAILTPTTLVVTRNEAVNWSRLTAWPGCGRKIHSCSPALQLLRQRHAPRLRLGALRGTAGIASPLSRCKLCRPRCIPERALRVPVASRWPCSILAPVAVVTATRRLLLAARRLLGAARLPLRVIGRTAVAALAL